MKQKSFAVRRLGRGKGVLLVGYDFAWIFNSLSAVAGWVGAIFAWFSRLLKVFVLWLEKAVRWFFGLFGQKWFKVLGAASMVAALALMAWFAYLLFSESWRRGEEMLYLLLGCIGCALLAMLFSAWSSIWRFLSALFQALGLLAAGVFLVWGLVFGLLSVSLKDCSGGPEPLQEIAAEEAEKPEEPATERDFLEDLAVASAYLNGVQEKVNPAYPRAVVGFKFIHGKTVEGYKIQESVLADAKAIIAEDWPEELLGLSYDRRLVAKLAEMRMGKARFAWSEFRGLIDCGFVDEAGEYLYLQNRDGSRMKVGDEPKLYFYILRLLWDGDLTFDDLRGFPMLSYKALRAGELDAAPDLKTLLGKGKKPTASQALGLE